MSNTQTTPNWKNFTDTANKANVLRYLQDDGWDVKKQTFYNHCKSGKLSKNRSGLYTNRGVKKYAETWLVRLDTGETVGETEEKLATVKTRAEIRKINTAQEREQFKLEVDQKKYILRSDMEKELVSRAIVLNNGLEHMIQTIAPELITLVGGDMKKLTDAIELFMEKKDEQLNQYANTRTFKVILKSNDY